MGVFLRAWLLIPLAWQLVSCASMQGAQPDSSQTVHETAPPAETARSQPEATGSQGSATQNQPLTQQLLFDVLLGEIAAQRGRADVSTPHYLQAADLQV